MSLEQLAGFMRQQYGEAFAKRWLAQQRAARSRVQKHKQPSLLSPVGCGADEDLEKRLRAPEEPQVPLEAGAGYHATRRPRRC